MQTLFCDTTKKELWIGTFNSGLLVMNLNTNTLLRITSYNVCYTKLLRDVLSRLVKITTTKGSRYQLLRQVSDQTGYYFIYDSQVINNDEEVKIRKGEYTVRNAIHLITGNEQIKIGILGNHILLSLPVPEKAPVAPLTFPEKTPYVIKGMARITSYNVCYTKLLRNI